ncbi:MAG: hypothetical protein GY811_18935 [Myxococcales bacterium]|nr:hypothetical protein [Myxococcales bacterium]
MSLSWHGQAMRITLIRPAPVLLSGGFLMLSAGCGTDDSDEPIVGEAQLSVLHYDCHFDMETREARAKLRLRVDAASDCFTIPMRSEGLVLEIGTPFRVTSRPE